ncbi:MAG TPA: hypothetical protein PK286_13225 [Devosia sp.]|nr:hypothetical protein [Devosia sp.]
MRLLCAAIALAAVVAQPAAADEKTVWRLFVADHTAPLVTAIDAATGDTLGRLDLAAPASLYATGSKKAVYAVEGSANRVEAISTGIAIDDHGDHGDITVTAPALLPTVIEGTKPVHVVEHDGHIALFFDGEGKARIVSEDAWLAGSPDPVEVSSAAPHHGVAVQLGEHVLISEPNAADPKALPVGMQSVLAGKTVGSHPCPDLHGEAASGSLLAFACATGLLVTDLTSAEPKVEFVPYASSLPEGKSTTLLGGVGMQYFVGNYGADRLVLIEPGAANPFRLLQLPSRRVHFAVDPARPRFVYVFTEDGYLREVDVVAGTLSRELKLTEPYSMDGEWSLPRPRIAAAGTEIAVSDPTVSVIHMIDAETFTDARQIKVDGTPFGIVAIGGSGETHD